MKILLGTFIFIGFIFSGCTNTWDGVKKDSEIGWDKTKEVSGKAWNATKEGASDAYEATKNTVNKITE